MGLRPEHLTGLVERLDSLELARKVFAVKAILDIIGQYEIDGRILGDLPKILDEFMRDEGSLGRDDIVRRISTFLATKSAVPERETALIRLLSTFL